MRTGEEIAADAAPQRPFSNSTEFEIWANNGRACYDCVHDGIGTTGDEPFCPILGLAISGEWPREWTRRRHEWRYGDSSGAYDVVDECTEFEERRDDGPDDDPEPEPPPPVIEGQIDMFEVFAEQIIDQSRARAGVPA